MSTNHQRNRLEPEYELLDTGIFDENRYYDVFIEYAKEPHEDILIQIYDCQSRTRNSHSASSPNSLVSKYLVLGAQTRKSPNHTANTAIKLIKTSHPDFGDIGSIATHPDSILFTENETNKEKLFNTPNDSPVR